MTARVVGLPDASLGNTSYVVDVGGGSAVAVDPRRDTDELLEAAGRLGCRVVAVLETHLHADFVSGGRELAETVGAEVYASKEADLAYGHHGVFEGDEIRFGDVRFEVLHTPGHTPEHVAYVLDDDGVFSGGSLIVGGAARTDLVSADRTDELSRHQFASIRRIAHLPGELALYPTHGAGSFCSAGPALDRGGTIADQRRNNPLLSIDDEDEFVRAFVDGFGSFPPYFLELRPVNRRPELLTDLAEPRAMSALEVADAMGDGAWLIDARSSRRFAEGHPAGAVSNALRPSFASWLGWIVPFGGRVVLLVDPRRLDEAVTQARRIGYDAVLGWLDGGIDAWVQAGLETRSVDEVDPAGACAAMDGGATLVDVRQRSEHAMSRIEGATHLELGDLIAGRVESLDATRPVVTHCAHGERSATAASLLERHGFEVANLVGGIEAWEAAGLPIRH